MRLLINLALVASALPSLAGCCHHERHHGCLFSRHYQHCVGDRGRDDDDWEDECSPCGTPCDCGCAPAFSDYGTPWTSDCGCTAPLPAYNAFPAPMNFEAAATPGCNCGAPAAPTFQQPTYMSPVPESNTTPPTPEANTETYYSPRPTPAPAMTPPPVPPVSFVPTRF